MNLCFNSGHPNSLGILRQKTLKNTRHQPQVAGTHLWKWLGPSPVLYAPRAGMLWDGVRLNPNDLATINAGGCPVTDALLVPANVPRGLDGGWGVMVQGLGLERIHISYCSSLLEKALSVPSHCLPRQLPFPPPDGPMVPWPLNALLVHHCASAHGHMIALGENPGIEVRRHVFTHIHLRTVLGPRSRPENSGFGAKLDWHWPQSNLRVVVCPCSSPSSAQGSSCAPDSFDGKGRDWIGKTSKAPSKVSSIHVDRCQTPFHHSPLYQQPKKHIGWPSMAWKAMAYS